MKNSFIYTVIFTFITCFVLVLLLSFTNALLQDKIVTNAQFTTDRAILMSLGVEPLEVATVEQATKLKETIQKTEKNGRTYYSGDFGSPATTTAFAGPGLWGTIYGYIAFSEDASKVVGFQVTEQNETPGLGARISESWFFEQLQGETIQNNTIRVGKGGTGDSDKDNAFIDGVSGATRTSDGIQAILNTYITYFMEDWR